MMGLPSWDNRRMHIDWIPGDLRAFTDEQLAAGRSLEELVCDGIRELRFNEDFLARNRKKLNFQIAEGIAAEKHGELHDGQEAIAEIWDEVVQRRGGE